MIRRKAKLLWMQLREKGIASNLEAIKEKVLQEESSKY